MWAANEFDKQKLILSSQFPDSAPLAAHLTPIPLKFKCFLHPMYFYPLGSDLTTEHYFSKSIFCQHFTLNLV